MKAHGRLVNRTCFALSAALALVCGCDANHVLGTFDAGGPTGSGGATGVAGSTATGTAGATATGAAGASSMGTGGMKVVPGPLGPSESWTGYVENFMFPSGSDALELTFAMDAQGVVVGTMVFGKGTPPPPATDPNVGYPPGAFEDPGNPLDTFGLLPGNDIDEGYAYDLSDGQLTAQRLRFQVSLAQLWAGWCALQTTPPNNDIQTCLPPWPSRAGKGDCALLDPKTNKYVPLDCGKYSLCGPGSPCTCTASGCGLAQDSTTRAGVFSFDVALSGDSASGSVAGALNNNVHFTKNP